MTGMGVVRLGPEPPSPVPLGWQVQRFGHLIDGEMRWTEPRRHALRYTDPEEVKRELIVRRKGSQYALALIPGGIEINTYPEGCAPCPELESARTRITWEAT